MKNVNEESCSDCPYFCYDAGTDSWYCDDYEEFVSEKTGYECCRYNLSAVPRDEYGEGDREC